MLALLWEALTWSGDDQEESNAIRGAGLLNCKTSVVGEVILVCLSLLLKKSWNPYNGLGWKVPQRPSIRNHLPWAGYHPPDQGLRRWGIHSFFGLSGILFLWSIRNNNDSKFANCHSKANLSYLQDGRGQSGGILFCSAASGTRVLLKYHGLTLLIDTLHPLTAKESSPVDSHVKKSIFTLYIFPGDFQLHIFLCTINN